MVSKDIETSDGVLRAAKTELKRREWANRRGKATRAYIREHPEVAEEFEVSSSISTVTFPAYVTRASVLLELRMRASRKEAARAVREWREAHPEEAKALDEEVRKVYERD